MSTESISTSVRPAPSTAPRGIRPRDLADTGTKPVALAIAGFVPAYRTPRSRTLVRGGTDNPRPAQV